MNEYAMIDPNTTKAQYASQSYASVFTARLASALASVCMASVLAIGTQSATAAATVEALPGAGKTVRPIRATWDTFWFGGVIVDQGLERLGYKVQDPPSLGEAPMYQALSQGDADFTVDTIMPGSSNYIDKYKDSITNVQGPIMLPGSIQGYMIDKATATKYDIKYISDLRDPAKAKPFMDESGHIPLVGPNVGWGSEPLVADDLKRLRLDKTVKLVQGEYNILAADVVSRYKAGKSVFLWGWYPNTATILIRPGIDMTWLVFKPGESAAGGTPSKNVVGCGVPGPTCDTGAPPTQYYITVNNKWAKENPAAIKFLSLVRMNIQDRVEENTKMMNGQKSEADIKAHAMYWIVHHQKEFDGWVQQAEAVK